MYRSAPRCGRCRGLLFELGVEIGAAWGCRSCQGVFLDMPAFRHLQESLHERIVQSAAERVVSDALPSHKDPVTCPRCDRQMQTTSLADVQIDHCQDDGIWFDRDELLAVARAIARERARVSVPKRGEVNEALARQVADRSLGALALTALGGIVTDLLTKRDLA